MARHSHIALAGHIECWCSSKYTKRVLLGLFLVYESGNSGRGYLFATALCMKSRPITVLSLFLLATFSALWAGEDQSDVQLRKRIVGTWSSDASSALTVSSNGTFVSGWTNIHSTPKYGWSYEGRWTITNAIFESSVTNTQTWGITDEPRHLSVERWKIVRLDEKEFVGVTRGITNVMIRHK